MEQKKVVWGAAGLPVDFRADEAKFKEGLKAKVMEVANAPGEKIYPGELAKALDLIAAGKDIDYVGASAVELVGGGESSGSFREIVMEGGKVTTVGYR